MIGVNHEGLGIFDIETNGKGEYVISRFNGHGNALAHAELSQLIGCNGDEEYLKRIIESNVAFFRFRISGTWNPITNKEDAGEQIHQLPVHDERKFFKPIFFVIHKNLGIVRTIEQPDENDLVAKATFRYSFPITLPIQHTWTKYNSGVMKLLESFEAELAKESIGVCFYEDTEYKEKFLELYSEYCLNQENKLYTFMANALNTQFDIVNNSHNLVEREHVKEKFNQVNALVDKGLIEPVKAFRSEKQLPALYRIVKQLIIEEFKESVDNNESTEDL